MPTNKYQQTCSVLASSKGAGETLNTLLKLEDFEGKDDFMAAASEQVAQLTGEAKPDLIFTIHEANQWLSEYISEDDIDEKIWAVMLHDVDTAEKLSAWAQCFDQKELSIDERLEEMSGSYIGFFTEPAELVENWLERNEVDYKVINTILPNLDVTAVADTISNSLFFANGHYFIP